VGLMPLLLLSRQKDTLMSRKYNSLRLLAKFETQKKGKVEVKRRPRIRRETQNG